MTCGCTIARQMNGGGREEQTKGYQMEPTSAKDQREYPEQEAILTFGLDSMGLFISMAVIQVTTRKYAYLPVYCKLENIELGRLARHSRFEILEFFET
jgi:hypothetical protein